MVSVLVSVATVPCRSPTLTFGQPQAARAVVNHHERCLTDLEAGIVGYWSRWLLGRVLTIC